MGTPTRGVWTAWILVVVLFTARNGTVDASHVVYFHLQSLHVPVVNSLLKTGYHFQPPRNWMNDPNGPMYYNGVYHLFYQYNPKGAVWGNIVWAHSISTDMINWIPLEPAIYPSKPFDINGTWSGSATILPGNKPAIMYTGIDGAGRQLQNVAFPKDLSDPYLREWTKPDYNPVIFPSGVNASAFRDPTTAWLGPDGHWRVTVGSKRSKRGMAYLYRSRDFVRWTKAKHPLHSSNDTGMWECPDFFPVAPAGKLGLDTSALGKGLKYVFKVSLDLTRFEYYTVGRYDLARDRYVPDNTSPDNSTGLRFDYGNFYASKTFFDPAKQRRILWGWSNESDIAQNETTKGWAGIQAIPRVLWLDSNQRQVVQWPIEELESLRTKQAYIHDKLVKSRHYFEVKGIQTSQADVEVTFDVSSLEKAESFNHTWTDPQKLCGLKDAEVRGGVGPFGLLVLASAKMEEKTAVFFRVFKAQNKHVVLMCHDPKRSSLVPRVYEPTFAGFVDIDIANTKRISLRSLIDNSVVESFGAGGKTCITSRVYPTLAVGPDAHLFVFNNGLEDIKVSELKAWEIRRPLMNGD
ncbi:beta-fructofuranosidase, insoluble isoenzyme 3-like [Phoenix dactylifera]|uniref:Beta-fructofuranosidase, insoluble isoenzyme 3-like n=1 Tax=Phoenix dactylifera TaxID=42345 RepID=A0A8B9AR28_PHODC|nr:beta-fructofuranosidase, insoluble isoenzyme 3-like [Phoenix dactylifera]